MERELFIRDADPEDAKKLVEIYSYYVLNTAVSFEYEAPSVEEFKNRIKTTKEKYPYMVCLLKDSIVGYAYAGPYSSRIIDLSSKLSNTCISVFESSYR